MGGAVRDLVMGDSPNDWDIITSAPRNIIRPLLTGYREHLLPIGKLVFYNTDLYDGFISIAMVNDSVEDDTYKRDFTVNALLYDGNNIIDYHNGLFDLGKRILRPISIPQKCFQDDPIRILRAIRFKIVKGFSLDSNNEKVLIGSGCLLSSANPVRIGHELNKWMNSPGLAVGGMCYLYETGLLKYILPELSNAYDYHPEVYKQNLGRLGKVAAEYYWPWVALFQDAIEPNAATAALKKFGFRDFFVDYIYFTLKKLAGENLVGDIKSNIFLREIGEDYIDRNIAYYNFLLQDC